VYLLFKYYIKSKLIKNNYEHFSDTIDLPSYRPITKLIIKTTVDRGRGVFTLEGIKKGEIIEVAPIIEDEDSKWDGIIRDYIFTGSKNNAVIPFGYIAMVNHSDEPNSYWVIKEDRMIMYCSKNIKKGDEITHDYGEEYWKGRKKVKK